VLTAKALKIWKFIKNQMLTHKKTSYLSCLCLILTVQLQASYLDEIGLTTLRARDTSLDGSGVTVAQVEASTNTTYEIWQTDPGNMGLNSDLFTYYDEDSTYESGGSDFDSDKESVHANIVGGLFFSVTSGTQGSDGIAPGVDAIEMFYANYYPGYIIAKQVSTEAKIINQSFATEERSDDYESVYDIYASRYNVLFCNGVYKTDDSTEITSPSSSYNGIAVGIENDSITPLDDGRSKPDLVAPAPTAYASYSSYTTPVVSGSATLLYQSAARGDAGTGTEADASDIRTLKALLLNSATKTTDWTHTSTHPLDTNDGAGIIEINNAQLQLAAGQYAETVSDTASDSGDTHLPSTSITTTIDSNQGWNLSTITNASSTSTSSGPGGSNRGGVVQTISYTDSTDDYYFECDADEASSFKLTATLVWNRNAVGSDISSYYSLYDLNNLDLYLYREGAENYELVASSVSTVDNVEHLYELDLEPGRYVIQVYKPEDELITATETYALAFNFEATAPAAASDASATAISSTAIQLNWSDNADNETGFRIERRISGDSSYSSLTTVDADSESYTDSNCAAGTTYEYQIIAYNDDGDADASETSATTYTVQEAWRLSYFGSISNSDDGADDADPDFDGLNNLVEFTTGSDPLSSSSNPISTDQLSSTQQFSFTWRSDSGYDYSIGYSEDLSEGFTYYSSSTLESNLSTELELISTETSESELKTLTYGITDSVTSDKVFLLLQIE
jgi:hypothetical protein